MQQPQNGFNPSRLSAIRPFERSWVPPADSPALLPPLAPAWKTGVSVQRPEAQPMAATTRCSERGCVFPAAAGTGGRCIQHDRQAREPMLFSSHQPTRVVMERAGFGFDAVEEDSSKDADQRRLRELRDAFLDD
jgi:hypothetical protein